MFVLLGEVGLEHRERQVVDLQPSDGAKRFRDRLDPRRQGALASKSSRARSKRPRASPVCPFTIARARRSGRLSPPDPLKEGSLHLCVASEIVHASLRGDARRERWGSPRDHTPNTP